LKLSRRNFLKLGAATATLVSLGSKTTTLKAFGREKLKEGGQGISLTGKKLKKINSTCLMCGVTDGITGFVKDGRLVKIEGNSKHPNNRGKICAKGQAGIQYLYDPYRIKYPMKRVGKRGEDKWERITRDEALNIVAEKIKEIQKKKDAGKIAIHKGRDRDKTILKRFGKAIGTKHTFNHTSICEASLKVGYETSMGADIDMADVAKSKYTILFGDNVFEASYMSVPMSQRIMDARAKGAKLVVFDPRLSHTAGQADNWFPVKPGTDGAVLLAMCNVLTSKNKVPAAGKKFINEWSNYPYDKLVKHLKKFTPSWAEKISGIKAADIERITIEFAKAAPKCCARGYNGLSNSVNGAMNARNLTLLNALVGNIDEEGGFCLPKGGKAGKVKPDPTDPEGDFPIKDIDHEWFPLASHHAYHLLPDYVEESGYNIDLYMIHMYNPIYSNPDVKRWREFMYDTKKLKYIVDFSPFWSETAVEVADLIIPDVTYLERLAVSAMPSADQMPFLQLYQPIVEPMYESSSVYDNYFEIARKVGGETAKYFKTRSLDAYQKEVVETEWGKGSWKKIKEEGVIIPTIEGKKYKAYDELTEAERDKLRKYHTYSKELKKEDIAEMKEKEYKFPDGDGPILDDKGKETKGVVRDGKYYKGFTTETGLFTIYAESWKEEGHSALPDFKEPEPTKGKKNDELILITGKPNVHTQSRTANVAWLMEIVGFNPAWINPKTAKAKGISTGDEIIIESGKAAKKMKCYAYVTEGINPDCIFVSASLGHWKYGDLASKGLVKEEGKQRKMFDASKDFPAQELEKGFGRKTTTSNRMYPFGVNKGTPVNTGGFANEKVNPIVKNWEDKTVVGYSPNPIMESSKKYTDPVGGEYAWSNTLVKVRKA